MTGKPLRLKPLASHSSSLGGLCAGSLPSLRYMQSEPSRPYSVLNSGSSARLRMCVWASICTTRSYLNLVLRVAITCVIAPLRPLTGSLNVAYRQPRDLRSHQGQLVPSIQPDRSPAHP